MQEKQCSKCNQIKPISEFAKDKSKATGYRSQCKECVGQHLARYRQRPDVKERRKQYRKEHPEYRRYDKKYTEKYKGKYTGKYKGKYKETIARNVRHWLSQDPNRQKAHGAVQNAVETGKLPHISTCVCVHCGNTAHHYHHHLGYTREHWLDVFPLCRSCHKNEHLAIENS